MFKLEDFPYGEFGITEESIIIGVAQYIVGRGYNQHECVLIIRKVLEVYRNVGIIKKFRVNIAYHNGIKCFDVNTDKEYRFGPDGRLYVRHHHIPSYRVV